MLCCKNLSFTREDVSILKNLSFKVGYGEALILRGVNGSGKTTLMELLAGLRNPTDGKITIEDHELDKCDYNELMQYIGHRNFMDEELTVVENLEFWTGMTETEMLIPAALTFFQLEDYADHRFSELSEGLKKRACLSLLIACPRTIWLLDEPTVNLDKQTKKQLEGLIQTRISQGGMVIIASHEDYGFPHKELKL